MRKRSNPDDLEAAPEDKFDGIPPTKWRVVWRMSALPGIMVSECGDLWDSVKGRHPAIYKVDQGDLVIVVKTEKGFKREYVAKLVYEAFFGPLPKGMKVTHRDGIVTHDDIGNLVAISPDATGGKPLNVYKDGKIIKSYASAAEYARSIGVATATVQRFISGENKTSSVITEVIGYTDPQAPIVETKVVSKRDKETTRGRAGNPGKSIEVVRDGVVIKTFKTIRECAVEMGMSSITIRKRLTGQGPNNPYKKIDIIRYAERKEK